MTISLTNYEILRYMKETTWGTTPGTPQGQGFRVTGVNSSNAKQITQSGELSNSREVQDLIQTSQRGGLSFNHELSYGNLDDLLESVMANAWAANVLTVGKTRKSFTMQREFTDVTQYLIYTGAVVTQLQLNFAIGKIISGSASMTSKKPTSSVTSVWTSGVLTPPSNAVMDPISSLQLGQEGGAGSIAGITDFSLNLQSPLIDIAQIGSVDPLDFAVAAFKCTGSFSCYFQDATYLAKHLSHVTTSLAFTIGGASNLKYAFLMNKVKLTVADIPNGGVNQPFIQRVDFQAFLDATNSTLKITRTP